MKTKTGSGSYSLDFPQQQFIRFAEAGNPNRHRLRLMRKRPLLDVRDFAFLQVADELGLLRLLRLRVRSAMERLNVVKSCGLPSSTRTNADVAGWVWNPACTKGPSWLRK
jgi:hypothetical protein